MKVLIQGKIDLLELPGGDRVQVQNTAKELRRLGIEVDIIPGFNVDYNGYDLVHLFQLDWTPETYLYAHKAKKVGKPLVLSPIHHSVQELKKFDDEYVFDFRRISKFLFSSQYKRDTFKNIYKAFFDHRKIYPTLVSVVIGLKNMHTRALRLADVVLVQTSLEAKDLEHEFGVQFRWEEVHNGVGEQFLNFEKYELGAENPITSENYIVCVGRIEPRKNQLNIIEAVESFRKKHNIDATLVVVGTKNKTKHFEYTRKFEKLLRNNKWITYVEKIPYEQMPALYKHAKVCVSASWFETTGLTSLEALFCNTNAVAAGPRAREYLGDHASYCIPSSSDSIEQAISREYFAKRPNLGSSELREYTWVNAAKKTLEVYNSLL